MSNDWYNTSPLHNGLVGIAWGLGEANTQNRWHGYVQAFLAQGMSLEQARAAAHNALGIRQKQKPQPLSPKGCVAFGVFYLILGPVLLVAGLAASVGMLACAGIVMIVLGAIAVILGLTGKTWDSLRLCR